MSFNHSWRLGAGSVINYGKVSTFHRLLLLSFPVFIGLPRLNLWIHLFGFLSIKEGVTTYLRYIRFTFLPELILIIFWIQFFKTVLEINFKSLSYYHAHYKWQFQLLGDKTSQKFRNNTVRVIYFKVVTLREIPISCETCCIEQNSFTDKAKCSFTKSSSNKERGSAQLSRKRSTACLLLAFWSVP